MEQCKPVGVYEFHFTFPRKLSNVFFIKPTGYTFGPATYLGEYP